MDLEEIRRRKADLEERHGPWTAHNARLAKGLYTIGSLAVNFDEKTRRAVQIAHDFFGAGLSGLRVLDLGAGEGGLSLEFAAQGAEVVCFEGREANVEKTRFVAEVLGLTRITFVNDDVRRLSRLQGAFDIVLCYGLLYHLDAASAFALVEEIARKCSRVAVVDTHLSTVAAERATFCGEIYHGWTFRECEEATSLEALRTRPWSSLDNRTSFWFTKPSLLNLLRAVGFGTVYEAVGPLVYDYHDRAAERRYKYGDRETLVAVRSPEAHLVTNPLANALPTRPWPESLGDDLVPSPGERQRSG